MCCSHMCRTILNNTGENRKSFSAAVKLRQSQFSSSDVLNGSSEHSRNVSMSMNKKEIDTQENDCNRLLPKIKTVGYVSIRKSSSWQRKLAFKRRSSLEGALMALVTLLNVRFLSGRDLFTRTSITSGQIFVTKVSSKHDEEKRNERRGDEPMRL